MQKVDKEFKKIFDSIRAYIEFEKITGLSNYSEDLEIFLKNSKGAKINFSSKTIEFETLKKTALSCKKCSLYKTRSNLVFGSGSLNAKLFFVGEAPGMEEDLQGLPFVGRAGGLLTKIIESIDLKRTEVYIGNILKCRPPENRAPFPEEVEACLNFIKRQIEIIKPKVICTLGKYATQGLLKTELAISKLRGKFYDYNGIQVMPTFHPAYLLRNPSEKRFVWEDVKSIKKELLK